MRYNNNYVITFENAIKLTPYCSEWPTLCWLFLKAYAIFKYLFLDNRPLIFITFGILALTLILYKLVKMHRRKRLEKENELVGQRFEENREDDEHLNESMAEPASLLNAGTTISTKRVTFKKTSADSSPLKENNCSLQQHKLKSGLKHKKATSARQSPARKAH